MRRVRTAVDFLYADGVALGRSRRGLRESAHLVAPVGGAGEKLARPGKRETKAHALARLTLFHGLSRRNLERLAKMTEDIDVAAGKVLCREGQTARQFFVIIEGEADVRKGGEQVRSLGPGDFFGETGLIEHTPLGTTISAATRLRFFVMSSQGFWSLIDGNAEVERRMLRRLVVENVAERRIAEGALRREVELNEHRALHDALTGLPNRTLFRDRIEQALLTAARGGGELTVLMMDLDRFKEVNDTLGHHAGDCLLKELGARLANALRASDTVARLGGDEFGVLLKGAGLTAIDPVLETIRAVIAEPVIVRGLPIGVEASVGAAFAPEHGDDVDTLLQRADVAMYVAKEQNAGHAVYDPALDAHDPARLSLVGELRRAIDEREFVLYYQPKALLRDGGVESVEALLRWNHPQRGLVMPDEFIPLAEQTSLIKPLTLYVLEEAIRQRTAWQEAGLVLSVAVNLSMRNLFDVDFPDEVERLVAASGADPGWLELEITETCMLTDPFRTKSVLERLSGMGIRISIDDFGTGYSSLGYLKSLPVSELKIDRSFVLKMLEHEDDAVIVRSTIDLGRNLGLEVVAEGVESEEVWDKLRLLGCDLAQGYYLTRPVVAAELPEWVRRWRGAAGESSPGRTAA